MLQSLPRFWSLEFAKLICFFFVYVCFPMFEQKEIDDKSILRFGL